MFVYKIGSNFKSSFVKKFPWQDSEFWSSKHATYLPLNTSLYYLYTLHIPSYILFRYDGTEIHEASACLAALSRGGAEPICYAPDADQAHVINHQKGEEMETGTYNEIPTAL